MICVEMDYAWNAFECQVMIHLTLFMLFHAVFHGIFHGMSCYLRAIFMLFAYYFHAMITNVYVEMHEECDLTIFTWYLHAYL